MKDRDYQRVAKTLRKIGAQLGDLETRGMLEAFMVRSAATMLGTGAGEVRRPTFEKNPARMGMYRELALRAQAFEKCHRELLRLDKVISAGRGER